MGTIKAYLLEHWPQKLHYLHTSTRRRNSSIMISGFGLGVSVASLIFLMIMILVTTNNNRAPFTFSSSLVSWPFNSNKDGNFSLSQHANGTHIGNFTLEVKDFGQGNNTHLGNVTLVGNFGLLGGETNVTQVIKNVSFGNMSKLGSGGGGAHGFEVKSARSVENYDHHNVSIAKGELKTSDDGGGDHGGGFVSRELLCDMFDGKWVKDETLPHYPPGSCPLIDRDFNCHLNSRPDKGFYKWRWQPNGCNIPRMNATDFLERLRGKKLVFVGDSLNRNMWESLVCILRHSIRHKKRVYEISGKRQFKKEGFYAFRFEDYNCTVDYVRAPFLVRESTFKGKNGSFATLRLDLMDQTIKMYHDADILVFNTGHWWTHEKTSKGADYYQEGSYVHPRLKALEAYKRALTTWGRWVDRHVDRNRTLVFFRGYSGTHFRGGQWNSGGQCHKETEPIFNETYLEHYPSKMRALEYVLGKMKTPVTYLNISRLTDYRKDAHPSIYRKSYVTAKELQEAERYQDCSHWCLPGVPDTWNELLYASLVKFGWGSHT